MRFKLLNTFFLLLFLSTAFFLLDDQINLYLSERANMEMSEKVDYYGSKQINKTERQIHELEISPKFLQLYKENKEFAGWIKIEDTVIDYAVMKSEEDNNFYLNHSSDGSTNPYGAIYMDISSDPLNPSTNLILYGHNNMDGSMFGSLKNYKRESYYKEHPIIKFDTLYENGEYEIISVFISKVYRKNESNFKYYQYTNIRSKEEFDEYVNNIKKLSLYEIKETAEYGDSLITLSTCDSWTENGRLAVVAKKHNMINGNIV